MPAPGPAMGTHREKAMPDDDADCRFAMALIAIVVAATLFRPLAGW